MERDPAADVDHQVTAHQPLGEFARSAPVFRTNRRKCHRDHDPAPVSVSAEQAGAELGVKALKTTMGLRVAYPEALGSGVTVAELADKQAKAELVALMAEVHGIMK